MSRDRMIMAPEVAERLGVSISTAYKTIRQLNSELAKKGHRTIQGRVSQRYFEQVFFASGSKQYEQGDDDVDL